MKELLFKSRQAAMLSMVCCLLLFTNCEQKPFVPDLNDTTPPVFDRIEVQLISQPITTGVVDERFDILTTTKNKDDIELTQQIAFNISATDQQSGITSIALDGSPNEHETEGFPNDDLQWRCSYGRFQGLPATSDPELKHAHFAFPTFTPNSKPVQSVIFLDASPAIGQQCACVINPDRPGSGAVLITGRFRVVITNGAGLTTKSQFFTFTYKNIGSLN